MDAGIKKEFQRDKYGIQRFCIDCDCFVAIATSCKRLGHIILRRDY